MSASVSDQTLEELNLKATLSELMSKKESIENDIKDSLSTLESEKGVGMHQALIDAEDYPRQDVDVYLVRHTRHKVHCLNTDHKEIMKQIEENLHALHAIAKARKAAMGDHEPVAATKPVKPRSSFAHVNSVAEGSPAEQAGLVVGDGLVEFGSVISENFKSLQDIAAVVQHSLGAHVNVLVHRNGREMRLTLEPKKWPGRGLLGCNIVPGGQ
ncbi:PREDICTED: 26S proteasome non-ATPase regulatory subunit 9-like [Priapulus caudatus]|uniref:26S proteasome non-ATPase regulatory subunit 9-like n=1 Tax=Priapulus caudatus TaxID=37621 RepID=A0ABM1EKS1_PRICU|nr:PREDICTED: 26S proteasome non-ATPase regulatory subunit 9-like [Priapulus caudatus]